MNLKESDFEAKAAELVRHIDALRSSAHKADKKNPATCSLVSMQEAMLLGTLAEQGALTMSDLASSVNLSVSSVTGLVDRLEGRDFVRRVRSGEDRRVVRAELTAQGRRLAALVLEGRLEMMRRCLRALSPREQDSFVSLFRKIAAALAPVRVAAALLLLVSPAVAQSPAGKPLTLPEAFQAARAASEALAASEAGVAEAGARVRELWGAVQPNVQLQASEFYQDDSPGASTGFTRRDRPEAKLTATQPLFSGFREFLALKAAKAKNASLSGDLERAAALLYKDVARAYFDLAVVQHELVTRRSTIELTAERVRDLEARAKLGRSRAAEVLQAKVQLAQLSAQLPDAEGRERSAQEVLAFLTGLQGPLTPAEPEAPAVPDLADAVRRARARPDVGARREERDAALFLETAQKRERWPTASLGANYYLRRVGFQEAIKWDVTATASLPLFTGGAAGARIAQAGRRSEAAEKRLRGAERLAESEARRAHAALSAELARGKALADAAELAERNSKAQGEDYKLGVVTNLDVLGALTALQNARLDLERSRYEAAFARAALETACGGPGGLQP